MPYEKLAVGGYAQTTSLNERTAQIQADYQAFLYARAECMRGAMDALCSGVDWPSQL